MERNRMIQSLKKWFNYLFKRNPFLNQKEEERYIRQIFFRMFLNDKKIIPYENWLVRVVPKCSCIYVEMKSRGCGYIFGR